MLKRLPKISYIILILIIVLIFLFIKLFFLSPEDRPSDYFPDAIMVKSFKGELENDEFTHIVDRIEDNKIQIKQIDNNTNVVMVYDVSDDMVRLVYTLEENELKNDYITGLQENRDNIIIKTPLEIGSSWKDNIGGVYRIIEVDSIVTTPAGKFESIVVEYKNDQFNVKEYYAKNIGLVKIVINNFIVNELVDLKIEN